MTFPFEVVQIDNTGEAIQKILKKDDHENSEQAGEFYELQKTVQKTFADVVYTAYDGKLTFTLVDGSTKYVDLPLELLVNSGYYNDETQEIVLVLSNGDNINIPAGDLVDVYEADEATLTLNVDNGHKTFSVKDGVFATEAAKDGKLYARTNGGWKAIIEGLPEITPEQIDDVRDGIYRVRNGEAYAILLSETSLYIYGDEDELVDIGEYQLLIEAYGGVRKRAREDFIMDTESDLIQNEDGSYSLRPDYVFYEPWSAWQSVIPSLAGYAKTADVNAYVENQLRDFFYVNELYDMESKTNKIDTLSSDSDHVQYPSAKAVVDYFTAKDAPTDGNFYVRKNGDWETLDLPKSDLPTITIDDMDSITDGFYKVVDEFHDAGTPQGEKYNSLLIASYYFCSDGSDDYDHDCAKLYQILISAEGTVKRRSNFSVPGGEWSCTHTDDGKVIITKDDYENTDWQGWTEWEDIIGGANNSYVDEQVASAKTYTDESIQQAILDSWAEVTEP